MSLIAVQVDIFEPNQIKRLSFGGVDKVITELPAGDVLAACDDGALLGIERKTPGDLLNTLRADRLFPQLERLRQLTPWAYLVITGGLYPGANDTVWFGDNSAVGVRETQWTWQSVQGALVTVQEIGVNVVMAHGDLDFEPTVLRLANRSRAALRVAPARDVSMLSTWEAIMASLPNIGPERAQALIAHCGTPAFALQFLADEDGADHKVPGVGRGLKRLVRDALGLEGTQQIYVMPREIAEGESLAETPELVGAAA